MNSIVVEGLVNSVVVEVVGRSVNSVVVVGASVVGQ